MCTERSTLKSRVIAAAICVSALTLGGCAGGTYDGGYSSVSFGISSGTGWDNGYYGRGFTDRDGDGVPNRWDRRPNNPYVD